MKIKSAVAEKGCIPHPIFIICGAALALHVWLTGSFAWCYYSNKRKKSGFIEYTPHYVLMKECFNSDEPIPNNLWFKCYVKTANRE
jgi:hypothetical protein